MAEHENKTAHDGQGKYDHSATKKVEESGGGRHDRDDRGDNKGDGDR